MILMKGMDKEKIEIENKLINWPLWLSLEFTQDFTRDDIQLEHERWEPNM